MSKKLDEWLNNFVAKGFNSRDLLNWPDEGSGTIVVTELPQVGEPHTIYELHQNVEPAYNWVAETNNEINYGNFNPEPDGYLLVVETYEDMLAKVNEDTHFPEDVGVLVYLRAEDRMFVNLVDGESGDIVRIEFQKNSAYTFETNGKYLYVLKSIRVDLGTPEHPLEDPMYWGTLYNGTEFLLNQFSGNDKAFILHQATFDVMEGFIANGNIVHQVSTLPTAQEAVTNYLDELIANEGSISVEVDNQVKYNLDSNKIYHWKEKPAIPDPIYNFWEYVEDGVEPVYTGELEWEDIPSGVVFTEIPYQDIFDGNLLKWIFKPEQGGEKVSYWIYTNGEWVNIDEIPVPSTSLGVTYANLRLEHPNVNEAVDIYYGEEKLKINDYYVFYPQTEKPKPTVAYATVSGLPQLTSETHDFVLTIHPKVIVDTSNDKLVIDVNGRNVYESSWQQTIPSEITVIVEGISQISIVVKDLPK